MIRVEINLHVQDLSMANLSEDEMVLETGQLDKVHAQPTSLSPLSPSHASAIPRDLLFIFDFCQQWHCSIVITLPQSSRRLYMARLNEAPGQVESVDARTYLPCPCPDYADSF